MGETKQQQVSVARRNAIWFAVTAAALAVSFLVKSPYAAYAIYAFLLLVGIAHFSSLAWISGLEIVRSVEPTTLQQGEDANVEVTLTNKRGWPIPWIFLEDLHPRDFPRDGDNSHLAVLMPGRSITLRYNLQCPRRGYHRVGPLLLESGDLFGLQKRFKTGEQQDYVSVLPTVAYIDTFAISTKRPMGPVKITNRIYQDPTRIAGVREYIAGDPLSQIHWKVSARMGELHTKVLESTSVLGATLVLDLHDDSFMPEKKERRTELAITVTASLAYLLQMSGEQVGMLTNARDAAEVAQYEVAAQQALSRGDAADAVIGEGESTRINPLHVPTRRSPIQAQVIIENLARVLPSHGLDINRVLMEEFAGLPRDAALLPVVPQVTDTLALTLAEMKLNGFAVTVFLIDAGRHYEDAMALLARHNIDVLHIEHERDLHELNPARIGQ
jgi:uncharacterized protein (DUF58 family)